MAAAVDDPALDALMLPLHEAAIEWPRSGASLFLRARGGPALGLARGRNLICEQGFKPFADALNAEGFAVAARAEGRFGLVLVLPPRQREEARALWVQALDCAQPGAIVVGSVANNAGARSAQDDFERLFGAAQTRSKFKCRVFWAGVGPTLAESPLVTAWRQLDAPRPILDGRFQSRPGLFAWDRIDPASALLAAALPTDLAGHGADFGAGFGYLAAEVLARCPGVRALDLYEAEARALDLARINLAGAGTATLDWHWHDVTAGVPGRYDFVVSNPPFHQSRADQPELGQRFIAAAAAALHPGGRLWLVANRHLPYEQALAGGFAKVRKVREDGGFKVIEAIKAGA